MAQRKEKRKETLRTRKKAKSIPVLSAVDKGFSNL